MVDRLVVMEDDASQLRGIESSMLQSFSYFTVAPGSGLADLTGIFAQGKTLPALIVVDFGAYTPDKVRLLQDVRAHKPLVPMIVLTPFGDEMARQRMLKLGVSDVLVKPVELDRLVHAVHTALKVQRMSTLIARLERHTKGTMGLSDIVGYSAPIKHVISMAEHVAQTGKATLIEGGNGCGKTLFAQAIHGSASAGEAFVTLDCEQLPDEGAAEMMFAPVTGRLDAAKGGTLYLREVGLLPAPMQQLLLERLQVMEGSGEPVRVLASSSVALEGLIRKGLFNPALYRMIRKSYIPVPSLSERREDIALLAQHFLNMHTARDNKFISHFSDDALRALANSEWPGNVAQLSSLVYRCTMLCNHDTIDAGTLRMIQQLEPVHYAGQMQMLAGDTPSMVDAQGRIKKLKYIEEEAIRYALTHFGGSMTKAAQSLGIGRSTLYRRMTGKDQMPRENQTRRPMMEMSSTDFS